MPTDNKEITIKYLANQLGVSKTTISKAISTLGLQNKVLRSGNKYVLSEEQAELIRTQIANCKSQTTGENLGLEAPKMQTKSEKMQTANRQSQTEYQSLQFQNQKIQLENQQVLIEVLQNQLNIKDTQISEYQEQIRAYQEQVRILTESLHDATTALSAEQALHAGTIQRQLTEQSSGKEDATADDQTQPKAKQGFFSKFFGKKE